MTSLRLVGNAILTSRGALKSTSSPAVVCSLNNGTAYPSSVTICTESKGSTRKGMGWKDIVTSKPFIIGTGVVVGAAGGIVVAPMVFSTIGFGAVGIKAGSLAASMMSTMGGAFTQAGSLVAVSQAVGATGTVLGSGAATAGAAAAGSASGGGVAYWLTRGKK